MATIRDIAQKAGVSVATVSNYLNASKPVSRAVSERIKQAVEELHYTPSTAAKTCVGRKTMRSAFCCRTLTTRIMCRSFRALKRPFPTAITF